MPSRKPRNSRLRAPAGVARREDDVLRRHEDVPEPPAVQVVGRTPGELLEGAIGQQDPPGGVHDADQRLGGLDHNDDV